VASAELRDTRRRIKSVQSTMKITRAMELIAASRIPRAQARVVRSKPYSQKLIEVIRNVSAASGGASHMLLEQRDIDSVGVLIVASDRGLAGAYASNIIRMSETSIVEHERAGRNVRIFAVGKKAQSYFSYRDYHIERAFLGVTDTPGYGDARAITNVVLDAYASGAVDSLEAYYTRYVTALTQTPTRIDLLPIQRPEAEEGPAAVDYSYEPAPAQILDRLLPRYVEATLFSMLLESSASEHSARRRAMKAATDNAEELIRVLTRIANRARQAEITTEISEIVGGAEALSQG
jgi:F-type H+-transporting ATPase subunit gamma